MIDVDGSVGGGQILRSALSLSAMTGRPFTITDIRGDRPTPGLRPQHRSAVELLAEICDADHSDVAVGAHRLEFRPNGVRPGAYTVDIGTAGSIALLFDTVLPLATTIDAPLTVTARGGTDVKWAPTMLYYTTTKLPFLRSKGLHAAVDHTRRGFYPAGGGEATLHLAPASIAEFDLHRRGSSAGARVHSITSADLSEQSVGIRQADRAVERLEGEDFAVVEQTVGRVDTDSPGSVLLIRLDYGRGVAGFDALGERGKPAEDVADDAVDAALTFDEGSATVDRHAADQLLVFLALAGGRAAIPAVTDHAATNCDLLEAFGFDVDIDDTGTTPTMRMRRPEP